MIGLLLTDTQVNSICGTIVVVALVWMLVKIFGD